MSMFPLIIRDMMRPLRMLEHQMRMAEDFFPTAYPMLRLRPASESAPESIVQDKEKFQVKMDVQHFNPQELTVKMVDGNSIVIEGKHEQKEDDKGFISRHFVRRFVLPKGHDLQNIASSLSSDGVLTITAPRKVDPALQETVIPVTHTGPEKTNKDESQ